MEPPEDVNLPKDVFNELKRVADDHGVVLVVGDQRAPLPQPVPEPREQRVIIIGGGHSGRRMSLGLAAALMSLSSTLRINAAMDDAAAQAMTLPIKRGPADDFPKIMSSYRHTPQPGMDKRDLQRMQRQHAQKASLKSRYKPR